MNSSATFRYGAPYVRVTRAIHLRGSPGIPPSENYTAIERRISVHAQVQGHSNIGRVWEHGMRDRMNKSQERRKEPPTRLGEGHADDTGRSGGGTGAGVERGIVC
jgi:hypothetical protein